MPVAKRRAWLFSLCGLGRLIFIEALCSNAEQWLGLGGGSAASYWFKRAAANDEPKSIEILKQLGWDDIPEDEQLASRIVPVESDDEPSGQPAGEPSEPTAAEPAGEVADAGP